MVREKLLEVIHPVQIVFLYRVCAQESLNY